MEADAMRLLLRLSLIVVPSTNCLWCRYLARGGISPILYMATILAVCQIPVLFQPNQTSVDQEDALAPVMSFASLIHSEAADIARVLLRLDDHAFESAESFFQAFVPVLCQAMRFKSKPAATSSPSEWLFAFLFSLLRFGRSSHRYAVLLFLQNLVRHDDAFAVLQAHQQEWLDVLVHDQTYAWLLSLSAVRLIISLFPGVTRIGTCLSSWFA